MNSTIPVTRTRILPPRKRSDILSRNRLLNILSELMEKKLTIIAAPAGYGKTSLLIDFVNQTEYPVCWYTIDSMDQDLYRFLTYFISAIQIQFPEFGHSALAALQNSSPDEINIDHLCSILVNDAFENITEHFIIVLDDYHLVNGHPPVEQLVSRFIQEVDENCHLIISSRTLLTLPNFPLMVARSQVGGLSFEELAFQVNEIQSLFADNYNLEISDDLSDDWLDQTEGWITGLLLSTQLLQHHIPNNRRMVQASGVGITEYLEQILSMQRPDLQKFLLRSSLLEEFNADLCREVIGKALDLPDQNWQELINLVLQNILFALPIGNEGNWIRFHHLFRDFLQNHIQKVYPEEVEKISQELANYHARKQDWEKAYSYLEHFNNQEEIANLIEKAESNLIASGRSTLLNQWLMGLPAKIRVSRPSLISLQGSIATSNGEIKKGLRLFNQAIKSLNIQEDLKIYTKTIVRKSLAYRLLGNHKSAMEEAEKALQITETRPELLNIRAEALRSKGVSLYQQGNLNEAIIWLTQSLEAYQLLGNKENEAILLMESSIIQQHTGNFIEAEEGFQKALDHWKKTENLTWQTNVLENLGFLQHIKGEYEKASASLEKALEFSKIIASPRLEAYALTNIGDLYRDLQATNETIKAYRHAYVIAQKIGDQPLMIHLDLAEASLARIQERYSQADERMSTAWKMAKESGSKFEQCLCYVEAGSLNLSQKEIEKGIRNLEEAVLFFENDNHLIEAARTHLLLSIAYYQKLDIQKTIEHLTRAFALTQHNQQPLVTIGVWTKDNLRKLSKDPSIKPLILNYLNRIQRFEEQLPELRRNLRQQASMIPFAPPKFIIQSLGTNQVRINSELITLSKWQTQISRDLFFILLAHPEGMTKEAIGVIFWPDISPDDLKSRFKNTIYRLRHAIGKETILFEDEIYRFNRALDYEYDVEAFQREINLAKYATDQNAKIQHYSNALKYYKGTYLPDRDDQWVLNERERLSKIHTQALLNLGEIHLMLEETENALDLAMKALEKDPCMETAHRLAMRVHSMMGNRADIERQYQQCKQFLWEEIQADPSEQTQRLHQELMN